MIAHDSITSEAIQKEIRNGNIQYAGNCKLKIFGLLTCKSGKRMRTKTRVFFSTKAEAIENGYRPCGNCMRSEYNHNR